MISDQIIQVLDAIAERMGVAINWTADNVMPYLQQLCARYITYTMAQSIATVIMLMIGTVVAWRIACILQRKAVAVSWNEDCAYTYVAIVAWCITVVLGFILLRNSVTTVNTVITCMTFPEKIILDFAQSFLTAG